MAREKAAENISVLKRALEVMTIHPTAGQQQAIIAAGVYFLVSAILSLLIESVRKTRV